MTTRERVSKVMAAVAEHPATPWGQWIAGLAILGVSLYLLVSEPAADKFHMGFHVGVGVVALLVLPGVFRYALDNAKSGLEFYRAWKAVGKDPPAP